MYKGDLYLARRICKTIGHIYGAGVVENFNWNGVNHTRVKYTCIHCKEYYKFDKAEPLIKSIENALSDLTEGLYRG